VREALPPIHRFLRAVEAPGAQEDDQLSVRKAAQQLVAGLVERLKTAGYSDIRTAHNRVFAYIDSKGTPLTALADRVQRSSARPFRRRDATATESYSYRTAWLHACPNCATSTATRSWTSLPFVKTWNASFQFDPADLKATEKDAWSLLPDLLALAGDHAKRVTEVRISTTMRLGEGQYETEGLWDSPNIVLKRSVLDSRRHFASVLLHEIAHASSRADHGSLPFMAAIDDLAETAAVQAVSAQSVDRPTHRSRPRR